jgi:general secretion pathway protein F
VSAVDTEGARFRYRASDAEGRLVEGVVQAPTRVIALDELRRQRLVPVDISPLGSATTGVAAPRRLGRSQALAAWARTVATLLEAGMPLDRALEFGATHAGHPAVAAASSAARADVQGGSTVADALRRRPDVFGSLIPAMASAGEESGALDQAMARLADHLDEANDLRGQIRSALVYPAIMAGASAAGMSVLLAFVVPRFAAMLQETGGTLPLSARVLVGMSRVVTGWWWLWLLLAAGVIMGLRAWLGDAANARRFHAARLRWPVIGTIETSFATARFARALGMLLGSGMPVLAALRIARGTVSNLALGASLDRAAEDVSHGVRIATALGPVLPPLGAQLIAVGEETGRVPELARQVAETYDRELKGALRSAVALIEPVLILFFAVLVGFVALAMLQAIYSINAGTTVTSNITPLAPLLTTAFGIGGFA